MKDIKTLMEMETSMEIEALIAMDEIDISMETLLTLIETDSLMEMETLID